ncbi:hypothetical protein SAMN05444285_1684 [Draconibacterium orientale]|jgi:hypothetical protein|uniref:Uncharacterized protein n=1 Tax=Draconibacterium orientale TaxID=1168034 RepID=X5DP46_9BACT|nr:hypothetical protein [Draconibacterium orientale]AHW62427.1 hypothetical protein FH5T_21610 [Draconibacterium orientale]SEU16428.1 hypothetical protein SAMN05444285_1684 [Draconibacterium orientale]
MKTIILRGESESDAKLILELAKKLNFSAKKISDKEAEEIGLFYSVKEGLQSGLLAEEEKANFLSSLDTQKDED